MAGYDFLIVRAGLFGSVFVSVDDERNQVFYRKYRELVEAEKNVLFAGCLGEYKYYGMDKIVAAALAR